MKVLFFLPLFLLGKKENIKLFAWRRSLDSLERPVKVENDTCAPKFLSVAKADERKDESKGVQERR